MSAPSAAERIAVLEAELHAMKEAQDEQNKVLLDIKDELTRYKGFIGGVLFIFTAIGAFIKTWPYISGFFK